MSLLEEWATAIAEAGGTRQDVALLLSAASDACTAGDHYMSSTPTDTSPTADSHISSVEGTLSGTQETRNLGTPAQGWMIATASYSARQPSAQISICLQIHT